MADSASKFGEMTDREILIEVATEQRHLCGDVKGIKEDQKKQWDFITEARDDAKDAKSQIESHIENHNKPGNDKNKITISWPKSKKGQGGIIGLVSIVLAILAAVIQNWNG